MAKRVRSSPRTSSVILSVSIISVSIIGGIVLFPKIGNSTVLISFAYERAQVGSCFV